MTPSKPALLRFYDKDGKLVHILCQQTKREDAESSTVPILLMAMEVAIGLWVFYDLNKNDSRRVATLDSYPDQQTVELVLRSLFDERDSISKTPTASDIAAGGNKTLVVS